MSDGKTLNFVLLTKADRQIILSCHEFAQELAISTHHKLEWISQEGVLDGITRSGKSHQRQRPGSRVSLQSGSGSPALRLESEIEGPLKSCLQRLTLITRYISFSLERDLSLEEYLSSSDEEESNLSKDEAEGDAIHQLERLILSSSRSSQYAVSVSSEVTDRDGLDGQSFSEKNEGHGSASPRQSNQENKNDDDDDDDEVLKRIKPQNKEGH
ncbi:hypothetical protein BSL78_01554 [Apostichopus japonicus]|uniref:Uncharacterized protein n=1 Tax=Stichopus japonicus TaxID=307972 RepID=A0A2G8LMQ6_STIJA|nr:hypothetical protein BSL78_01554 [Apostichopus japonicus]